MTGRYNSSLLMLTDEHARRFNELYDQLNCKNIPLKDKGKVLEELTSIIFTQDIQNCWNAEEIVGQAQTKLIYS